MTGGARGKSLPKKRRDRPKEEDQMRDNTRERSSTNTTTTNTRQNEESRAVRTAGTKGCPDLNPGHHQVGLLQQSRIIIYEHGRDGG